MNTLARAGADDSSGSDKYSLYFSEVAGGSTNNRYYEIYNPTCDTVDLTGWTFPTGCQPGERCVNGCAGGLWSPSPRKFTAGKKIAVGGTYVLCHPSASNTIKAKCNQFYGLPFNGYEVGPSFPRRRSPFVPQSAPCSLYLLCGSILCQVSW